MGACFRALGCRSSGLKGLGALVNHKQYKVPCVAASDLDRDWEQQQQQSGAERGSSEQEESEAESEEEGQQGSRTQGMRMQGQHGCRGARRDTDRFRGLGFRLCSVAANHHCTPAYAAAAAAAALLLAFPALVSTGKWT